MKGTIDVVALGEILVDFTDVGLSDNGEKLFEQNPGGAPANFLTVASHMGLKTAMIGKVGNDIHGRFLLETLKKQNINTEAVIIDDSFFTTLAFVSIGRDGEREFSFARKPGADTRLKVDELDSTLINNCKVFHMGSLSLTDDPAYTTTWEALKLAKAAGAVVSYDPNYRASLWENEEIAIEKMKEVISFAEMMKVSEEESFMLTNENDCHYAAEKLLEMGPRIVAITLGKNGVYLVSKQKNQIVPGFEVKTVDTTGAGDSFWGGFVSRFLSFNKSVEEIMWDEWIECANYGNATACLCVQKRGGIPSIPTKEEVEACLKEKKK